jgi:chromosome segregation ATPase
VLRFKIKSTLQKVTQSSEHIEKPRLQHNELAVIEDELKPESEALNNFVKHVSTWRKTSDEENSAMKETIKALREEMSGKRESFFLYFIINCLTQ